MSTRGVGILGGGQLAKMLYEAALPLGLRPTIYAERMDDSAGRVSPRVITGKLDDPARLAVFLSAVDTVVFENEFVDTGLLKNVAAQLGKPVHFTPSLEALAALRDKTSQKALLDKLGIASAPYAVLPVGKSVESWLADMGVRFPEGFVLKWGRMGYDGKGVHFVEDPKKNDRAKAIAFCAEAVKRGISCYAEQKVPFARELALVAVRSTTGEFSTWPLVLSEQRDGICVRVAGPGRALGVTEEQDKLAFDAAKKIAEALSLAGCFAIELFETERGELLVNELAPRVHNSGHYTQNASMTSQYENHWRAVLGLPLGATAPWPAFVMVNLLGPEGVSLSNDEAPLPVGSRRVHVHWYGKRELRPGRKLGHLNAVAGSAAELEGLYAEVERCRSEWEEALKKQGAANED